MSLASSIVAFIKAFPVMIKLFEECIAIYYSTLDHIDEENVRRIAKKRSEILLRLRDKGISLDERKKLLKDLYSLHSS